MVIVADVCKKLMKNIKYDLNLDIPIRLILRRREIDFRHQSSLNQQPRIHAHIIYMFVKRKCCQCVCRKLTQNIKYDLNLTIPIAMEIVTIRKFKEQIHMKS